MTEMEASGDQTWFRGTRTYGSGKGALVCTRSPGNPTMRFVVSASGLSGLLPEKNWYKSPMIYKLEDRDCHVPWILLSKQLEILT